MAAVPVRELPLDLDAFEGPFDLLLTLVLKDELPLLDVEVASVVLAFVDQFKGERSAATLEPYGEFLILVASLLELKARELLADGDEIELDDLDPDEAAAELAARLAEYRRIKAAAGWLEERLAAEGNRFFRIGPAPLLPVIEPPLQPQAPEKLAAAIRALAAEPPAPSLTHLALRMPPLERFLERFRALLRGRRGFQFDDEVDGLTRLEQAVAFLALLELRKAGEIRIDQREPFAPIAVAVERGAPRRTVGFATSQAG
jgi:segregation and condensation protein A